MLLLLAFFPMHRIIYYRLTFIRLYEIDARIIYNENSKMFVCSVATNTIQITLQMQIENPETSLTPPTPSSPGRDAQSPEGIASLSSGSSDNALGK